MTAIYAVVGVTGEWSDRREWPVAAYTDELSAQAHVEAATRRANEIFVATGDYGPRDGHANEHDPAMEMDYTGTQYEIWAFGLCDRFGGAQ